MKRRIFLAIGVPDEIKKKAEVWQKRHSSLPIRWIKPSNLHITLVPPWYADEVGLYETAKEAAQAVKKTKSFSVSFSKVLLGPPGQPPRLIWTEGTTPPGFIIIKEALEDALLSNSRTGFLKKEMRPPRLHLTLARFRRGSLKKMSPQDGDIDWRFEVNSINLMESKLHREGAEYVKLKTVAF